MNVQIIENGGWHFTNIKNNKDIYYNRTMVSTMNLKKVA